MVETQLAPPPIPGLPPIKVAPPAPRRTITLSLSKTVVVVDESFTISGYVKEDDKPVPRALVTISIDGVSYVKYTDSSGKYEVSAKAPKEGTLIVKVTSDGASVAQAIRVNPPPTRPPSRAITLDISKTEMTLGDTFKISGYVSEDGKALANMPVAISIDGISLIKYTDSSGRYEANVTATKIGRLTVKVVSGPATASRSITVKSAPSPAPPPPPPPPTPAPPITKPPQEVPRPQLFKRTITISLSPSRVGWGYTFTVVGAVREETRYIPNAEVTITTDTKPPLSYTTRTDSKGEYRAVISSALPLPDLKPGERFWVVTVTAKSGDASASAKLTIEPSDLGPPSVKGPEVPVKKGVVIESITHPSGDVKGFYVEMPWQVTAHIISTVDRPVIAYMYESGPESRIYLVTKGGASVPVYRGGYVSIDISPNTPCTKKSSLDSYRAVKFPQYGTYTIRIITGRRIDGKIEEHDYRTFRVNVRPNVGRFIITRVNHPTKAEVNKPVKWSITGKIINDEISYPEVVYHYVEGPAPSIVLEYHKGKIDLYKGISRGSKDTVIRYPRVIPKDTTIDTSYEVLKDIVASVYFDEVRFPVAGTYKIRIITGCYEPRPHLEFSAHDSREVTVVVSEVPLPPTEVTIPSETEITILQRKKEGISRDISSAKNELSSILKEIPILEGKKLMYENSIESLKSDVKRLEDMLSSLRSRLESIKRGGLKVTRDDLQSQIDKYRNLVQQLESVVSGLRLERDSLKSRISAITKGLVG